MLVDLVQRSKGLGVWFRVLGVGRCVWCLVMNVGCWVFGVGCLVSVVGCWVLGIGCWLFGIVCCVLGDLVYLS